MESTRTVGYIRVSTAGQAEEGVSLEAQRVKIEAYCDLHDLELMEIYEDAGLSGKSIAGRPAIQQMLSLVNARKVDNVVIFKLDRLARNVKEAVEIAELLQKKRVALHSISERLDTASAHGRLFYNILSAMAAWERDVISERTKTALELKKGKGERVSRHAPFGFTFDNLGNVVQDVKEKEVISKVLQLREDGYSIRGIVQYLADHGYRNRAGNAVQQTTVARILRAA